MVGQSAAILRYVGRLGGIGLYPSDPIQALQVDEILDTIKDSGNVLSMTVAGAPSLFISEEPWSKDEVLTIRKRLLDPEKMMTVPYVSI